MLKINLPSPHRGKVSLVVKTHFKIINYVDVDWEKTLLSNSSTRIEVHHNYLFLITPTIRLNIWKETLKFRKIAFRADDKENKVDTESFSDSEVNRDVCDK